MITKHIKIALAIAVISCTVACSSKVVSPEIQKLKEREAYLKETTKLNNLKLDLEKEKLKVIDLTKEVKEVSEESLKSARLAKSAADDLNDKPSNTKLSAKANKLAKQAAKDTNKSKKLNNALDKSNDKIKSLEKDIEKSKFRIAELKKE